LPGESAVNDLRQRLARFDGDHREELVDRAERYTAITKWALVAAVLAFAVFLVVGAPTIALGGPIIGVAAAGYFAARMRRASKRVASIDAEREAIVRAAHRLDADVDDPRDVHRELERIERERSSLNETISRELGVLADQLDVTVEDPETAVRRAEEELEAMEAELGETVKRAFSRAELETVQKNLDRASETIEDLERRLREHRQALREFADRARSLSFRTFTGEPLDLQVNGLEALDALAERLEEFVRSIERDAAVSRTAHRVFESIEAAETEKVSTLFEGECRAGELFARITDGRYQEIRYDPSEHQILVERSTGREFTPAELSNGTRDQLYLCIRVALARQLPNVETGFFVMDDAFLTADADRLEAQSEVIAELVDGGWQVIYLSAKRETIDVLESHADGDVIELNPLP
ncbi:MAG: ATP-binding protein, partial [archaeon]